jgi:hypothetical protein
VLVAFEGQTWAYNVHKGVRTARESRKKGREARKAREAKDSYR